ncbi:hypothetical protein [Halocynthiibacter styelae]|uniref:Uncharacterized protein n=1 Tax=Halocynthiibacter styelae TaxID=2761955 RepID=A0A8J7IEL8_9RHOB|nr:hypothetical protein [Paenihalocynthiibacter styelae]MBI1493767.1 hypothetical protein [Paenihalocynthiibacter styelae]
MIRLLLLTIALTALLTTDAQAQRDPLDTETPFCVKRSSEYPSIQGHPNGYIARLGQRYFRVCSIPLGPEPNGVSWSQEGDPNLDAFLAAHWPGINYGGMIIKTLPEWSWWAEEYEVEIGRVRFGEAEYTIQIAAHFPHTLENAQAAFDAGRRPNNARYVFVGPDDLDLSPHWMTCDGQFSSDPTEEYSCFIHMRYQTPAASSEDEIISVRYHMSWWPGLLNSSFYNGYRFDFDNVPEQIRAMQGMLEYQDVTDHVESLRSKVEVVE